MYFTVSLSSVQPAAAYDLLSSACNKYCMHYLHTDLSVAPFVVRSFADDCICNAWLLLCDGVSYNKVGLTLATWFLHYFSSDANRSSVAFPYVCSEPYYNARIHDDLHHAVYRLQHSAVTLNDSVRLKPFTYDSSSSFSDSVDSLRKRFGNDYVDSCLASVHRSTFDGPDRNSLWSLYKSLC